MDLNLLSSHLLFIQCFFSLQARFLSRIRVSPADTAVTLTLRAERVKALSLPASARTALLETDATAMVLRPAALVSWTRAARLADPMVQNKWSEKCLK